MAQFLQTVTLLGIDSTNPAIPENDLVCTLNSDPVGLVFVVHQGITRPLSPYTFFLRAVWGQMQTSGETIDNQFRNKALTAPQVVEFEPVVAAPQQYIIAWEHIDECYQSTEFEPVGYPLRLVTFVVAVFVANILWGIINSTLLSIAVNSDMTVETFRGLQNGLNFLGGAIGLIFLLLVAYVLIFVSPSIYTIVVKAWNEEYGLDATYMFAVSRHVFYGRQRARRLVRTIWAERGHSRRALQKATAGRQGQKPK